MPRETMDDRAVAAYLHMDLREVHKLASRDQLPCRKVGGRYRFTKIDVDHWVERRMHTLAPDELARIERGVSAHHGLDIDHTLLVCPLIPHGGLAAPFAARTRAAALRGLVDLADKAQLVHNRPELLDEIRNREDLCSTAMIPGAALPHPRHPLPYDIAQSFLTVAASPGGIPFGAPDGSLTRLFFLICCKDERTHLHVLARLAQMLHGPRAVEELAAAGSPEELSAMLLALEETVLGSR